MTRVFKIIFSCLLFHSLVASANNQELIEGDSESVRIIKRELTYSFVGKTPILKERNLIKLLDQNAVNSFGDFYSYQKNFDFKIIKADGSIKVIEDKHIIKLDSKVPDKMLFGRKGKKKVHYKIAIAGLELGDVLDVSFYHKGISKKGNGINEFIAIGYSIDTCSIVYEFGPKHFFRAENYNYEQNFERTVNEGVTRYTLLVQNIKPLEDGRYIISKRKNPYYISFYNSKSLGTLQDLKSTFTLPEVRQLKRTKIGGLSAKYSPNKVYSALLKDTENELEDRVNLLYHYLEYGSIYTKYSQYSYLTFQERSRQFAFNMFSTLNKKEKGLEVELVALKSRYNNEQLVDNNVNWGVRVKLKGQWEYFSCPELFVKNGENNHRFEGVDALGYRLNEEQDGLLLTNEIVWPKSTYLDNRIETDLNISLSNFLKVSNRVIKDATKSQEDDDERKVFNYRNLLRKLKETEISEVKLKRSVFGESKDDLLAVLAGEKFIKKEFLINAMPDRIRKKLREIFNRNYVGLVADVEIEDYLKQNPILKDTEIGSVDLIRPGIFNQTKPLSVEFDLVRSNYIHNVDEKLIIDVGFLIGGQLSFDKNEKEKIDELGEIEFLYPRSYQYTIHLELPSGFKLLNDLSDFNYELVNDYGFFKSSYELNDGVLLLHTEKAYLQTDISSEEIHFLYDVTEAADRYYHKRIVLEYETPSSQELVKKEVELEVIEDEMEIDQETEILDEVIEEEVKAEVEINENVK